MSVFRQLLSAGSHLVELHIPHILEFRMLLVSIFAHTQHRARACWILAGVHVSLPDCTYCFINMLTTSCRLLYFTKRCVALRLTVAASFENLHLGAEASEMLNHYKKP